MQSYEKAPELSGRFACIVDRDAQALAAVISSYLFEPQSYLPLFLLPGVKVPKNETAAFMTEGYVANIMADHIGILITNALAQLVPREYVILAGLSEAQKSFLPLPSDIKVIEIAGLSDVEPKLASVAPERKKELKCTAADAVSGLFIAQRLRRILRIDENAPPLPEVVDLKQAMVVVENVPEAAPVLAVNYASSIDASILVVDGLGKHEGREVQYWIQRWKDNDDVSEYEKLRDAVASRIDGISFRQFLFATFFTEGLPYSLVLENVIPCTYVHLRVRPDLFIVNSILASRWERFSCAVVFSPVFFTDEETDWLCKFFTEEHYLSRSLIGRNATLAALDFHAQHFPYDLLHICSHGGEVDGYEMFEQFTDRDGKKHSVHFEEVIGTTPVPDKPNTVQVHRKVFPRTLDGLRWMSPELEQLNLPEHIILDMWKCTMESKGVRKKKGKIAMSCAIACADSIHQGEFNCLGAHTSPFIFNNTCWSWHEVALFFLSCGARGYIGTLWAVNNEAAVLAAKTFYGSLFSGSTLSAFHRAIRVPSQKTFSSIGAYISQHCQPELE